MRPEIRADLLSVFRQQATKVVLLLDDSGSMSTVVNPPGPNGRRQQWGAGQGLTRWQELIGDVQVWVLGNERSFVIT